jgi:hypothetical protein
VLAQFVLAFDWQHNLQNPLTKLLCNVAPPACRFMPKPKGPYAIRSMVGLNHFSRAEFNQQGCIPSGMVRRFTVLDVPPDMTPGGKGPLLSAQDIDLALLWRRVQQIGEINRRMRETVQARAH